MKTRSITLAAAALAAALALAPAAPAAAQITFGPQLAISVEGGQPESAWDFLPGQPVPVQVSFACDYLCQEAPVQTEWWIWAEQPGDVTRILSYDGATQSWRRGLAPAFARQAADFPLQRLPGRLELPEGYWDLHFEIDTDPNGVRDTAVDGVDWFEARITLPFPPYFTYYLVQVDRGFFEDFNDGKSQRWLDDGTTAWTVASRRYRATAVGAAPAVFSSLFDARFSDFTYGADVRLLSGGAGSDRRGAGLLFRASGGYRNGYVFHVNAGGSFLIFKRVDGRTVPLMRDWKASPAIRPGDWNRLEVRALRDQLEFRVNGTVVKRLRDGRFARGKAGVKAYGDPAAGDRFEFDDAILRVEFVD